MLHTTLISPHPETPTFLLTCTHTLQRTVIDPIHPAAVQDALGSQHLDLILLTAATELTLAAAEILHHRTGAPVLASNTLNETALPVARYLTDGEVVGLGPLAQTIYIPEGDIMCYALGSEGLLFTGPLFAGGATKHKANRTAIAKLGILPPDTTTHGGSTQGLPLGPLLEK
ncbi:MAG: hypothetical protein EON60_06570 [Alphaproteobacteria bacterium]|nr:MAG: hypothetical protein EON60_06570 [Alphaproteobacteria bacterium]